jgi:hypothetical protein
MNVSKSADAEFLRLLQQQDPERYERLMKNIRQDLPGGGRVSEDQALTNFMLGLPTGQWRFRVIAGPRNADDEVIQPVPHVRKTEGSRQITMNRRIALVRKSRTNASLKKLAVA